MSGRNKGTQKEETGFKVSDRRMFTPEGDPIERSEVAVDHPEDRGAAVPARDRGMEGPERSDEASRAREESAGKDRPVDFASFVLSLATSAMACLGEVPDPASGETVESLDGAKQMIDVLTMLQEKTRGNLDREERELIENLLYELRMRYLSKAKVIKL